LHYPAAKEKVSRIPSKTDEEVGVVLNSIYLLTNGSKKKRWCANRAETTLVFSRPAQILVSEAKLQTGHENGGKRFFRRRRICAPKLLQRPSRIAMPSAEKANQQANAGRGMLRFGQRRKPLERG